MGGAGAGDGGGGESPKKRITLFFTRLLFFFKISLDTAELLQRRFKIFSNISCIQEVMNNYKDLSIRYNKM